MARFHEDGDVLVLRSSFEDRQHLMTTQPKVFTLREHYRDYPYVLVVLAAVKRAQVPQLLEDSWRRVAPPKLVRERDATRSATVPTQACSGRTWCSRPEGNLLQFFGT